MEEINEAFGKRLRELRESAGLSQKELAERARINLKYLSAIERGERNITLVSVEKIRRGLDVRIAELFRFNPREPLSEEKVDASIFGRLLAQFDKGTRKRVLGLVKDIHRLTHPRRR